MTERRAELEGSVVFGPERPRGQGLGVEQAESGNRAILALLTDPEVLEQVDLVLTWREGAGGEAGAYEAWATRGMVRFQRVLRADGALDFELLEVIGENPLACQDPHALRSLEQEWQAAKLSSHAGEAPERSFIEAEQMSYPFGYERVAQLFDSPHAPDLAVSPNDWSFGAQKGQHGALNVRQSRAPLWFAGPRVRAGEHALAARAVDVAPTVLAALDFPKIDGADASGRRASERGVEADVWLARQDGRALEEILDFSQKPPEWLYIFLLDGMHPTHFDALLEDRPEAFPNLCRLREGAAVLRSGSIVNFPSITWPSHTTLGTGTWCGHHDVVNPTYYVRERGESLSPQGQQVRTEGFSNPDVESLHEAFHRVRGHDALTAAIYAPFGRGADHAALEGRNLGDRDRLRSLTAELSGDSDPRWREDGAEDAAKESMLDGRGVAQVIELFTREDLPDPDFVFHELIVTDGVGHEYGPYSDALTAALRESDRRIGRVLDLLEQQGRLEQTLIVLTADHGMSPQAVELRANPARHVLKAGLSGFVAEPMIWLRDLAVSVERAADGRTARVRVRVHDADADGERADFDGAEVRVSRIRDAAQSESESVASGRTGPEGVFGFATPAEVDSSEFRVEVRAEGFNDRNLRLDGACEALDLRRALYGRRGA